MIVLGIESSCDELSCAVLDADGLTVKSNVVHSQIKIHALFGGVVPEVASRDHVKRLDAVLSTALKKADISLGDIQAIAVTSGPGLLGCLLCGIEFAKGLSVALDLPVAPVNHLEGHLLSVDLGEKVPEVPFVALLVSGGHTMLLKIEERGGPYKLIGATRDDAAGEAFDKTAKILGLGYPGGAQIDKRAQKGRADRFKFPTLMAGKSNFDFSFSGLKTSAARTINELPSPLDEETLNDFCAGFQKTVVNNLLNKALRACRQESISRLVIAGGVVANSELRREAEYRSRRQQIELFVSPREYCTDNAAMIARAGWLKLQTAPQASWTPDNVVAQPSWPLAPMKKSR